MARPLKYDDQFRNIIFSNLSSNFLFCIKLKVPSTTFRGKSNLQKGLRVLGIIDIISFFLFLILCNHYFPIEFIEKLILYSSGVFGLIALDASKNLKKLNSSIYYYWRIVMMIMIPFYELSHCLSLEQCYVVFSFCHWLVFVGITLIYVLISLYLTKIAWSFSIQIQNGNELLILHGKYLEQMLSEENMRIEQKNIYIPPLISRNNRDTKGVSNKQPTDNAQVNLLQFKQPNDTTKDFKNINPFRHALDTIGMN